MNNKLVKNNIICGKAALGHIYLEINVIGTTAQKSTEQHSSHMSCLFYDDDLYKKVDITTSERSAYLSGRSLRSAQSESSDVATPRDSSRYCDESM